METRKISIIVGSLRKGSLNRQLAQHAARFLEEQGAAVEWLEYSDLPYMNQDIEYPAPAAVARVRQQVAQAQGLWFFVPEYNHGIPGPLKNLLDWLSRPVGPGQAPVLRGKWAAMSGAGGSSGTVCAQDQLLTLLHILGMQVSQGARTAVVLDRQAFTTDQLSLSEQDLAKLQSQATAFWEEVCR